MRVWRHAQLRVLRGDRLCVQELSETFKVASSEDLRGNKIREVTAATFAMQQFRHVTGTHCPVEPSILQ